MTDLLKQIQDLEEQKKKLVSEYEKKEKSLNKRRCVNCREIVAEKEKPHFADSEEFLGPVFSCKRAIVGKKTSGSKLGKQTNPVSYNLFVKVMSARLKDVTGVDPKEKMTWISTKWKGLSESDKEVLKKGGVPPVCQEMEIDLNAESDSESESGSEN